MAKNENRNYVTLVCSECKHENYTTQKNKKNTPEKLGIKKACPNCGKHTTHKEKKYINDTKCETIIIKEDS